MITDVEELKDVLEKHLFYDRSTMRGHEQGGVKLVICPILETGYSDIFILINNYNVKWRESNTIRHLLDTFKENNKKYYRAFVLSVDTEDLEAGDELPIWLFGKRNNNERHILQILDITNIWEEP